MRRHLKICETAYHQVDSNPGDATTTRSGTLTAPKQSTPQKRGKQQLPSTTGALLSQASQPSKQRQQAAQNQASGPANKDCPFCNKRGHYAENCTAVTNPDFEPTGGHSIRHGSRPVTISGPAEFRFRWEGSQRSEFVMRNWFQKNSANRRVGVLEVAIVDGTIVTSSNLVVQIRMGVFGSGAISSSSRQWINQPGT